MNGIHCYVVGEYRDPELEGLTRALKSGNPEAIRRSAKLMAGMVRPDTVLVPVPSHTGRAGYTLQLASELSRLTGAPVADILVSQPRASSYELKHQGRVLEAGEMEFRLAGPSLPDKKIMLVDNVVASGNTAKAAVELLPGASVLALASDSGAIGRLPGIAVHPSFANKLEHSIMHTEKRQGVILVRSDGMTLAADMYRNPDQRERMWRDWIDVAIAKGLYNRVDFSVSDHPAMLSSFKGLTDRQIGFLLQGERPERTITALQASFARRQKVDCYDADAVNRYIHDNGMAFRSFVARQDPITQRLNTWPAADVQAVENVPRLQRIYRLKGHLTFDGSERITGLDDVAWLFRHLQERSVENTYAVLAKGDESMVLHLGVGNGFNAITEPHLIAETARRMGAEKVWFVHNHPSGEIYASGEDIRIHNILKEQLGSILQPSVIINTDTGRYGVFTEKCSGTHYWDWYSPDGRGKHHIDIPVYAFDKFIFHGRGQDRYKFVDTGEVAKFLSTQRLGERDKYMLLAMNRKTQLNGYFHLPYSDLKQVSDRELVEHISRLMIHSQSEYAILTGRDDGVLMSRADGINDRLEKYSGGHIKLIDMVQMGPNNNLSYSWYGDKMLAQKQQKYRNPHMRVVAAHDSVGPVPPVEHPGVDDVQVTVRGSGPFLSGHIRCSINGQQQMFREMKPSDFQRWRTAPDGEKRELEHTLSLKYFRYILDTGQERRPGFKR